MESDGDLVRRCLAGDEQAYRELIARYRRQVYSLALRMVRVAEDAEDLTQETFVRMFRALERYDPARPFGAWLHTITARLAIDHIRRRRMRPLPLQAHDADTGEERTIDIEDLGPGPDVLAVHAEEERAARDLIDTLPAHYRVVVAMRHQQDLSYEEIAEALHLPLGTVKARIHRARALLKERLEARGELE
ncbi:MAG TPA: sigma-70 family RNA polymerase sigma factor [Candidatus Eisenbacteria bacterium]|nr:sigma-70 family RNA polymerase sigma factor [Candidatus Eisenbacteria bacterium]